MPGPSDALEKGFLEQLFEKINGRKVNVTSPEMGATEPGMSRLFRGEEVGNKADRETGQLFTNHLPDAVKHADLYGKDGVVSAVDVPDNVYDKSNMGARAESGRKPITKISGGVQDPATQALDSHFLVRKLANQKQQIIPLLIGAGLMDAAGKWTSKASPDIQRQFGAIQGLDSSPDAKDLLGMGASIVSPAGMGAESLSHIGYEPRNTGSVSQSDYDEIAAKNKELANSGSTQHIIPGGSPVYEPSLLNVGNVLSLLGGIPLVGAAAKGLAGITSKISPSEAGPLNDIPASGAFTSPVPSITTNAQKARIAPLNARADEISSAMKPTASEVQARLPAELEKVRANTPREYEVQGSSQRQLPAPRFDNRMPGEVKSARMTVVQPELSQEDMPHKVIPSNQNVPGRRVQGFAQPMNPSEMATPHYPSDIPEDLNDPRVLSSRISSPKGDLTSPIRIDPLQERNALEMTEKPGYDARTAKQATQNVTDQFGRDMEGSIQAEDAKRMNAKLGPKPTPSNAGEMLIQLMRNHPLGTGIGGAVAADVLKKIYDRIMNQ